MELPEQVQIIERITQCGERTTVNVLSAMLVGWISNYPAGARAGILNDLCDLVLEDAARHEAADQLPSRGT